MPEKQVRYLKINVVPLRADPNIKTAFVFFSKSPKLNVELFSVDFINTLKNSVEPPSW